MTAQAELSPERKDMRVGRDLVSYLEWPAPAGVPGLHFAHANGFNAYTYRRLLAPLAREAKIYAMDMRGHGFTTLPADPEDHPGWEVYRDDLIRFLDGLDGRKKVLVGHSMGAIASVMAAALRPDLVRALVLIEPVVPTDSQLLAASVLKAMGIWRNVMPLARQTRKRRVLWPAKSHMVAAYAGKGAFKTWDLNFVKDYVEGGAIELETGECRLACDPNWEAQNFLAGPPRLAAVLPKLKCPVTLMHGTRATTCAAPLAAKLQSLYPLMKVVCIEGATHFLPMEHPERVLEEVRAMLALKPATTARPAA